MDHAIIRKKKGHYSSFPRGLYRLDDGRITVGCQASTFANHAGIGWAVYVTSDDGATWIESDDPQLPPNWPWETSGERMGRSCRIMPDGSFLAVTFSGYELWDPERRREAAARGLRFREDRIFPGKLVVSAHKVVVIRSRDRGASWERRTWVVPGFTNVHSVPLHPLLTRLEDGSLLYPFRGMCRDGTMDALIYRSNDEGETWRLQKAFPRLAGEWALVEVEPGVLLGHIRNGYRWGHPEDDRIYALEVWSADGGRTWTYPVEASFQGYPNHLLKLRDGRILCTFGYRRRPMGVRALISEDGGRSWDLDHEYVLRDDGGTTSDAWPPEQETPEGFGSSDVGYPTSVELGDGSILTVYYITTPDAVTQVACTRWHPDRDRRTSRAGSRLPRATPRPGLSPPPP